MAPANTGSDSNNKKAVMKSDQTNKFNCSQAIPFRILIIVVIKLIAPKIELTPAMCKDKMAKSIAGLLCPTKEERGGYIVQPVPTPASTILLIIKRRKEGGSNQKLKLFMRGKAMSGEPINNGIIQLPKPPTITGMIKKKIITSACAVTTTLYNCPDKSSFAPLLNSTRIIIDKPTPTSAAHKPKIKYKDPISLWLVDINQRNQNRTMWVIIKLKILLIQIYDTISSPHPSDSSH